MMPLLFLMNKLQNSMFLPLTVLQKILLGALKWYGPREGLVFILLRRNARYFTEQHKKTFLELVEYFTVTSISNAAVSDGSACEVVSLSLKLEL